MIARARPILLAGGLLALLLPVAGCGGRGDESTWSPPPADIYAATYIGTVTRSLDGGLNWLPLGSDPVPLRAYRKTLALGDDRIFVATSGGGLYVLDDVDEPYVLSNRGLRSSNIGALFHRPADGWLWAGTWGAGVFRSTDNGRTWMSDNENLTTYHVNCLVGDPREAERLYCGTTAGLFSRAGGAGWRALPGLEGRDVRSVFIRPEVGEVWVGLGRTGKDRVLLSEDHGATWKPAGRGLPDAHVLCLAVDGHGDRLLAGTARGVYVRSTEGTRWARLGSGLPRTWVFSLATFEGYCFAATARGLYGIAPGARRWMNLSAGLEPSAVTDVMITPAPAAPSPPEP